jgi:pectate lyase
MLPSILFVLAAAVHPLASALPVDGQASWDVEGFARDNPLGPTTGGEGGSTVTVANAADLKKAVTGDAPKVVLVTGNITLPSRVKIGSNTSVVGVGTTAHITGSGFDLRDVTNVVIRNLRISYITGNDCITIRNSTRVWVDHNEFTSDITQGPDAFVCPPPITDKSTF